MHTRYLFRTDFPRLYQLLLLLLRGLLQGLLPLELPAATLEVLTDVQWWCPEAVSILTLGCRLLPSRASWRLNKLINTLVNPITTEMEMEMEKNN